MKRILKEKGAKLQNATTVVEIITKIYVLSYRMDKIIKTTTIIIATTEPPLPQLDIPTIMKRNIGIFLSLRKENQKPKLSTV